MLRMLRFAGRAAPAGGLGARLLVLALVVTFGMASATAADVVAVGFLGLERGDQEPVSLLDPVLYDEGVQGARLGIEDNNATARFMNQQFLLEEIIVPRDGDVGAALHELLAGGAEWIVSDLPRDHLNAVLDSPDAAGIVVFNVRAPDDILRNEECRANLFHTAPSRRMLTDALAQFLVFKRWNNWGLVVGNTPEDALYAEALRASAQRFGGRIVGELKWPHTPLARRAEGGFHTIQREVPVFLQGLRDHEILLIADETDYFGEYFPYQTRAPRPVGGTQGLVPTAWHRAHESWGAAQLHRRFERTAERWMTPRDFAAWVAVRSLGEAAARTGSVDPETLADYLRSENFELGAYLGNPLTFRPWDRQLRQPVLLAAPRMVVSVSPQEGFLHPVTPLDSLGHDEPETRCTAG